MDLSSSLYHNKSGMVNGVARAAQCIPAQMHVDFIKP